MKKNNILLSVRDLSVQFKTKGQSVTAVDRVSFDIAEGQTIGLVGESGSGKSVTSLAIMGLVPQPPGHISGEIWFKDQNLLRLNEKQLRPMRGNRISMIFQEPMTSLNPVFRVGNQVAEVLRLHKSMNKKQALARTIELFDLVGIPEPHRRIRSYPHEMSGGQKQRVMIAMAIACQPELLICDEPTTALDVTIQKQVLELLMDLQKQFGMSMLFITHDLGVIADLAENVVVMYRSQLVEKNSTQSIFHLPKHPYTKGLLACRPHLDKNPERLLTVADYLDPITGKEKQIETDRLKPQVKKDKSHNPVLLSVNDLKTYFPIKGGLLGRTQGHVKAVDGVSFEVRRGETLGLVGESGCGKTTLGRTLLRLQQATSGSLTYDGVDVLSQNAEAMRSLRSKMQIIFQDPYASLNPRMTIADILLEPLTLHGPVVSKAEKIQQAVMLLEKVGMSADLINRYPHEFSGGQRQRICIARALAVNPEFIVCDESVSALDVSVQAQVLNLLLDLQREYGLTYIFISHDLSVVNFIADRVAVMQQGRIVELNSAAEIYSNPQHGYTKKLLSAVPKGI